MKKTPVRKRSTAIGQTEFAGASASSVVLKPAGAENDSPPACLGEGGRKQRTRESAKHEGGAERAKASAPTCSVFDARTGTSAWKLNPTVRTTVVISRTRANRRRPPHVAEPVPDSLDHPRRFPAGEGEQLAAGA